MPWEAASQVPCNKDLSQPFAPTGARSAAFSPAARCGVNTSLNFASQAGCAGHAGAVTNLPSTTASVIPTLA